MFANITSSLEFHSKALVLRAERQRIIASNIANADTPGFVGRDIDFKESLRQQTGLGSGDLVKLGQRPGLDLGSAQTHPKHIALSESENSQLKGKSDLAYTLQTQPSADSNSVDLDHERASFVDNSVHYEATLRFINGQSKTLLSAIQGQ